MFGSTLGFTNSVGNEISELADTLKDCLANANKVLDPDKALKNIPVLGDIIDVVYTALASILLPIKPLITFLCEDVVPEAANFLEELPKYFGGRRRLPQETERENPNNYACRPDSSIVFLTENENCYDIDENTFCPSYNFSYFYDAEWPEHYKQMVRFWAPTECSSGGNMKNAEGFLLGGGPYDNSNTEVYQHWRIGKLTVDLCMIIVDNVCGAIDQCLPDGPPECKAGSICGVINVMLQVINTVIEYAMGTADLHDAEINNMRLKAVFKDRITIIHNQKLLDNTQKELHQVVDEEITNILTLIGDLQNDFDQQYNPSEI